MPVTTFDFKEKYRYLNGFDNHHQLAPSPPPVSHGLY